jgi:CRP-like cAMP-binding protein
MLQLAARLPRCEFLTPTASSLRIRFSGGIGVLVFELRAQLLDKSLAALPTGWNTTIRPTPPRFVGGRCQLNQRLAQALLGHGLALSTTHQALADNLGTVREIVSRLLARFERAGWVRLSRERIEVLDGATLRQVAAGERSL